MWRSRFQNQAAREDDLVRIEAVGEREVLDQLEGEQADRRHQQPADCHDSQPSREPPRDTTSARSAGRSRAREPVEPRPTAKISVTDAAAASRRRDQTASIGRSGLHPERRRAATARCRRRLRRASRRPARPRAAAPRSAPRRARCRRCRSRACQAEQRSNGPCVTSVCWMRDRGTLTWSATPAVHELEPVVVERNHVDS